MCQVLGSPARVLMRPCTASALKCLFADPNVNGLFLACHDTLAKHDLVMVTPIGVDVTSPRPLIRPGGITCFTVGSGRTGLSDVTTLPSRRPALQRTAFCELIHPGYTRSQGGARVPVRSRFC
jgi:hypothetical protein